MDICSRVPAVSRVRTVTGECICYTPSIPESCRRCTGISDDTLDEINSETVAQRLARRAAAQAQAIKDITPDVLCLSEDDVLKQIRARLAVQRESEAAAQAAMEELTLAQLGCRYVVLRGPATHP